MGVWNAQVMETACKLPGTETGVMETAFTQRQDGKRV